MFTKRTKAKEVEETEEKLSASPDTQKILDAIDDLTYKVNHAVYLLEELSRRREKLGVA